MGICAQLQQRSRAGARVRAIAAKCDRVERDRQVETAAVLPVATVGGPQVELLRRSETARPAGRPDVA
jgi:hypothetical protein